MIDIATDDIDATQTEAEPAEPGEPAPSPESDAATGRRRRKGLFAVSALAVLCFLLAVGMTLVAVSVKGSADAQTTDRRSVESVAGRLGEALLSWDYEQPEQTRDRVLALGTGHFGEQYDQAYPDLQASLAQVQFRAVAEVRSIWVSEIEGGSASAVLVADRSISTTSGQRSESDIYLRLDLVKSGDSWRVDGVTNLRFALAPTSNTPPGG